MTLTFNQMWRLQFPENQYFKLNYVTSGGEFVVCETTFKNHVGDLWRHVYQDIDMADAIVLHAFTMFFHHNQQLDPRNYLYSFRQNLKAPCITQRLMLDDMGIIVTQMSYDICTEHLRGAPFCTALRHFEEAMLRNDFERTTGYNITSDVLPYRKISEIATDLEKPPHFACVSPLKGVTIHGPVSSSQSHPVNPYPFTALTHGYQLENLPVMDRVPTPTQDYPDQFDADMFLNSLLCFEQV